MLRIEKTNKETGETVKYVSIRIAARELGVSHPTILSYIKSPKLSRGIYLMTFGVLSLGLYKLNLIPTGPKD